MAQAYARLIKRVMAEPPPAWRPRPWPEFRVDPAFPGPSWRGAIPAPLKKGLRRLLFHAGLSRRYE